MILAASPAEYISDIFIPLKSLLCIKIRVGAVQFLIENFSFLGLEGQNWMLIVAALLAVFVFYVWRTRDRS